jgi:hypothetical protein
MTTPVHDPRVDELRQRLRSLGYLDAGLDRFVLAPARDARKPAAIAVLASLRIGLLAALSLGPAAAIGLSARMPGLIAGPRDAVVAALYLGGLFGLAVALAAFLASLFAFWAAKRAGSALARRARQLALAAGTLVTLLCLVYLTLWWQIANGGAGWSAPILTAFALVVAAAISLVLGHAVTVAAMAVALAATGAPAVTGGVTSWWMAIASVLVAVGGAALLLLVSSRLERRTAESPALTVVSSGVRVQVIAVDGFDPHILQDLSSAGQVPALTAAFGTTLAQLEMTPDESGDPARVWTTVATGQPPGVHGVEGLETRRVAGLTGGVPASTHSALGRVIRATTDVMRLTRPALTSGTQRLAKTFWEVAAQAGLRTVVVNWWATWPAPDAAGVVLTDRATLRLERGGQLDAEVAPVAVYEQLRGRWPAIRQRAETLAADALRGSRAERGMAELLRRSAELDAIQLSLVAEVANARTDLSVVYLPGLDIAQHALLAGDGGTLAASTLAARLDALKDYYVALDRLLNAELTPQSDEIVMVVTGSGRVTTTGGARLAVRSSVARRDGSIAGPITSVAPTILYALGVPVGRDLASAPLLAIFNDAFTGRYPVRFVPTYGQPSTNPALREGQPLDQDMIDRLRSLGYVR